MGPRLFRHGYLLGTFGTDTPAQLGGFNGATPFQTWIPKKNGEYVKFDEMFQWGHAFSDMDTWEIMKPLVAKAEVSMGPRLFRHGYGTEETQAARELGIVSMGPRLFRHGYSDCFSNFAAIEKKPFCERSVNLV